MESILLISASNQISLIKTLIKGGLRVIAANSLPKNLSPETGFCSKYYKLPHYKDKGYASALLDICIAESISLIIPLGLNELPFIDEQREVFRKFGFNILMPEAPALEEIKSRWQVFLKLRQHAVPTPQVWKPNQISDSSVEYPLIVMPSNAYDQSRGYLAHNARDLSFFLYYIQDPIIQPYIKGNEYVVDVISNPHGQVISAIIKMILEKHDKIKVKTISHPRLQSRVIQTAGVFNLSGLYTIHAVQTEEDRFLITHIKPVPDISLSLSIQAGAPYYDAIYSFIKGWQVLPRLDDYIKDLTALYYNSSVYHYPDGRMETE